LTLITVMGATMGTLVLRWTKTMVADQGNADRRDSDHIVVRRQRRCRAPALGLDNRVPPRLRSLTGRGQLVSTGRINALAEAAAPDAPGLAYLAAFQYAFTIAGVLAPAVVALFSVTPWLPWLVVAAGTAASVAGCAT